MTEDAASAAGLERGEDAPEHRPTLLMWGFMGAGKSTVGRALARHGRAQFIDLDAVIEADAGMSIRRIFQLEGEPSFRRREKAALRRVLALGEADGAPRVVSLGGGTLVDAELRAEARRRAFVVVIEVPFDVLAARVGGDRRRPLFEDLDAAQRLYDGRLDAYREAAHVILYGQMEARALMRVAARHWRPAAGDKG